MTNPISDPLVENVIVDDIDSVVKLEATMDGVATVTINRPDKRNALNALVIEGLTEHFETLQGADHVRVVFLRGEGTTFCAGADLEWMRAAAGYSEDENRADSMTFARMLKAFNEIPALTVTLVDGSAMGGAAGLVAISDYAVCTAGTRFAYSEAKLGLIPAMISPYVVAAIGPRVAKSLFATGRLFDAAYADKIGLVHEVVSDAEGLEAAKARIVRDISSAAPEASIQAKQLVWEVAGRHIDHGLMEETARRIARKRVSDEGQEGVRAFLEKRKPSWLTQ